MKKFMVPVMVLIALVGFSGCGKQSREAAMSEALEKAGTSETSTEQENFLVYEGEPTQTTTTGVQAAAPAVPAEEITVAAPVAVAPGSTIDKPTNEQIQQALKGAGLYDGPVDGKIGPKSKKAIRKFQIQNDLTVDGKVGRKTWSKMQPFLANDAASVNSAAVPEAAVPATTSTESAY